MDTFHCGICGKRFSGEDNLREHKKKHQQYPCPDCPQAFATASTLENHRFLRHNQTGGGRKRKLDDDKENVPPKRRLTVKDDPKDHYKITPTGEQRMKKFNTTANRYRVNFTELEVTSLSNVLRTLRRLFSAIISDLTGFMRPSDLVRLTVQCPELDYPISLPFMRVSQLTVDRLLSEIERMLQSYEDFVIDQSLEIELVHVRLPSGAGRKRPLYVDLERTMKEKRCFIKISNTDELCCAKAIVTAKAKLDKNPNWNSIRQGRSVQRILAENYTKK